MIIITGGAGYIGSHTVVELINNGFEILIVDNFSNSDIFMIGQIEKITNRKIQYENIDLCDSKKVFDLFDKYEIDSVIHFAAFKAVGESVDNPLKYYHNNLLSLINLLFAIEKNPKIGLIFSSSCTVYGQPDILPVKEENLIKMAESPYGNTKQICEEIIQDVVRVKNIKAISLRYFNPIGAHESALIGELPIGTPLNLVPLLTQTAYGLRTLNVYGNDYDTPDGTAIRDYINVNDLASAHVCALKRLDEITPSFEVFNVGTGKGTSVMELIKTFERVNDIKIQYKIVDRRQGDIEKVWADTSLANKELKWKAKISLEETLISAWNWEKYIRNVL